MQGHLPRRQLDGAHAGGLVILAEHLLSSADGPNSMGAGEEVAADEVRPFDAFAQEEADGASDNDDAKSKVSAFDLEELQDIKIRTMYRMVKEVDLSATTGRPNQPATFLYLTNKQAHAGNVVQCSNKRFQNRA